MCISTVYQENFVSCFPLELVEEITTYLDGRDVLACSRVCKDWLEVFDQENIWRKLCINRGWFLKKGDVNSWRNLFWLNQNWCQGLYTSYKFSDDDLLQTCMSSGYNAVFTDFTLLESDDEFLILPRRDGINIWDITSDAKLHQRILNNLNKCCSQFDTKVNKKFIIYLTGNYIQIFKKGSLSKMYRRIKVLHFREGLAEEILFNQNILNFPDYEMEHKTEISENYLVLVQNNKTVFMWLLKPWEFITSINLFESGFKIIETKIVLHSLFFLQINGNEFRICVYDLKNKIWTLHIQPDDSNIMLDDVQPRLIVDESLFAILYPHGLNRTVLKVWNFNGEILKSVFLPKETYTQCCLVNGNVIYRSSMNTITIWSSKCDSVLKELDVNGLFNFIEICPGDLLLVARHAAFEIWNWKKGIHLYTIREQAHLCYTRLLNSYFYATLAFDIGKETSNVVPQITVFYFGKNVIKL